MSEEQIVEKDAQIAELNKKLEESQAVIKEATEQKLNDLKDSYKSLAEEKGLKAIDVNESSEEVVKALITTLESISSKVEEKTETPKGTNLKGKVAKETIAEDHSDYFMVSEGVTGGIGMFKSHYNAPKGSVYYRETGVKNDN